MSIVDDELRWRRLDRMKRRARGCTSWEHANYVLHQEQVNHGKTMLHLADRQNAIINQIGDALRKLTLRNFIFGRKP